MGVGSTTPGGTLSENPISKREAGDAVVTSRVGRHLRRHQLGEVIGLKRS